MTVKFSTRWGVPKLLASLAFAGTAAGPLVAQVPCVPCPPLNNCPPGTFPIRPGMPAQVVPIDPNTLMPLPTTPGTPGTPATPTTPFSPAMPAPAAPDFTGTGSGLALGGSQAAFATERGGQPVAAFSPNMMGDILGARSMRFTTMRQLELAFVNPPRTANGVTINPNTGTATLAPFPGMGGRTFEASLSAIPNGLSFEQQLAAGQTQIAPINALATQILLQSAFSGTQLTPQQIAALPPQLRAVLPQTQGLLNRTLTGATGGITFPNVLVGPVSGELIGNDLIYTTTLTAETVVPLPGASSVVGRIKLSEDNNPLPRDRFIFAYDNFAGVPFTSDKLNVNRFQFGAEKTFLDGRASAEIRLPFAGTLNSTSVQGFETTNTELGNLRFALKYLAIQREKASLSTGLGVTLPTADDTLSLSALDGTPLYRFENESVTVEPFVALLLTPNERLFGQVWSSVNFDTSGGQLTWNPAVFGGSGSARIVDLPLLAVDGQIGYWLIQRQQGWLRGLAPFGELHWNYLIAQDQITREIGRRTVAQGLSVASIASQELNLTVGATALLSNNMTLTLGASAPLLTQNQRTFDAQFGLRVNWYFGRTAASNLAAASVNSY